MELLPFVNRRHTGIRIRSIASLAVLALTFTLVAVEALRKHWYFDNCNGELYIFYTHLHAFLLNIFHIHCICSP